MINSRRLFGTNGIRGLVNKELTTERAIEIGAAVGTFFKRGNLLLGFDARTSGPMLANAVTAGLNATGCNVFLGGMAPTPALQFAVKKHKLDGGVIVTASHNPPEYNGIKVVWKDGIEISREQEIEIENMFFDQKTSYTEWNKIGATCELSGIIEEYVHAITEHVNVPKIIDKHFHVVVDAANSVGSLVAPYVLRELGCKVTTINANIDGTFPGRPPEPRPENLKELSLIVKAVKADLGVAYDGDADRSVFVDEQGEIHMGDKTFAIVERQFLTENEGERIVTPVSSSTIVKDIADAYGGELVWTKVGSVTVAQTMKKLKAKLGGEENGGIFYGPHQPVRDGAMSTALILNIMAKTSEKLSKLISTLPKYYIEKSKTECPEQYKERVLKDLTDQMKNLNISIIDGIKIWFKDKSAILIRPSGTEPIYRLYAEAKTSTKAQQLIAEYSSKIKKALHDLKG
jgi:phosphomannomutase/phosphoglucomutase